MEKLSADDISESLPLFFIEARVEECLNQSREFAAQLEAKAEEKVGLIRALFPKGKRSNLDKRQKDRVEFVESVAKRISIVANKVRVEFLEKRIRSLEQLGVKYKDDGVYQLITRKFSELLIEETECAPGEAREVNLKEEMDRRFQEYVKQLEFKLEKQLEDQRQNLKQRDKEFEEQLEQVKKKQKSLPDQYLPTNANPSAQTVVGGSFPVQIVDAAHPKTRMASTPAVHDQKLVFPQVQQQPSHSAPCLVRQPAPGLVRQPAPGLVRQPAPGLVRKQAPGLVRQ